MTTDASLYSDIQRIQEQLYDKCGFRLTNLQLNLESTAYGACSFELNGYAVEHRISKVTPTKTGQFVTIWKRNKNGITEPFDISDHIDFIVITSKSGDKIGQFIFPTAVLADNGIITQNGKMGKRGIRVYPSWDIPTNQQAEKTQNWQQKYFVSIENDNTTDVDLARRLLNHT